MVRQETSARLSTIARYRRQDSIPSSSGLTLYASVSITCSFDSDVMLGGRSSIMLSSKTSSTKLGRRSNASGRLLILLCARFNMPRSGGEIDGGSGVSAGGLGGGCTALARYKALLNKAQLASLSLWPLIHFCSSVWPGLQHVLMCLFKNGILSALRITLVRQFDLATSSIAEGAF